MQIRDNRNPSFPNLFGPAQSQGAGGFQNPNVRQQRPEISSPQNPFKQAALGASNGGGADALGIFQQQMAQGVIQPNLKQPPIPPEGAGRRLLAVG